MGIPGRPGKLRRQEHHVSPALAGLAPSPPTTDHSDSIDVADTEPLDLSSLPLSVPDLTGDYGCIPLELLGRDAASPDPPRSQDSQDSCTCATDVATLIRTLRRHGMSHATLTDLRAGADLMAQLLTCPECYNLAKPPRLTIQNVLLIGRLMHQVTLGYRRHLRWVHETWSDSSREAVHIGSDTSTVEMQVSGRMFRDLVVDGLRLDARRLTELASQFAVRQHNRHLVGHELCPDSGRCWRERYDMDTDPLDICPKSAASRTLTPCFRIVDAVSAGIKMYVEEVNRSVQPL